MTTYEEITSNTIVQGNSWMGFELRSSDPINMYFCYMRYLMLKFENNRKRFDHTIPLGLAPYANAIFQKNLRNSAKYTKFIHNYFVIL